MRFTDHDSIDEWARDTFGGDLSSLLDPDSKIDSGSYDSRGFIPLQMPKATDTEHPSLYFVLGDTMGGYGVTQCSLSTTYVDARVKCMAKTMSFRASPDCGVDAIRKSLDPPSPEGFSILDSRIPDKCDSSDGTNCGDPAMWHARKENTTRIFHAAFNTYLDDDQSGRANDSTLSKFMRDPVTAVFSDSVPPITLWPSVDLVERRLSLLYNTLWKAGWTHRIAMIRAVSDALERDDGLPPLPEDGNIMQTPMTFHFTTHLYALDYPWIVMYFIAVVLMLAAAVFTLVIHCMCRAPPILGFVSSLLRDSRYFEDEGGNSTEDGPQRTRRLGGVRVKNADVQGEGDVGRIAFALAREGVRVRRGRVYE